MPQNTIYFSIVIPTLNEVENLPLLLRDLSHQSFFLDHLEVLHVDAHSEDATVDVAAKYGQKLNLTTTLCKERNVSVQRNLGARKARGKYIIFMDADNRLPSYFLDELKVQLVRRNRVDIFSIAPSPFSKTVSARDRLIYELTALFMKATQNSNQPHALGAMLGIKRAVFTKVQFRPEFKVTEDREFAKDALEKGFRYELFDTPEYIFSLRRLDRDGFVKQAKVHTSLLLRFFDKKARIQSNFGYDMSGGGSYLLSNKLKQKPESANDQWLHSWQQIWKSIQSKSTSDTMSVRAQLSWLVKLRKYTGDFGMTKK